MIPVRFHKFDPNVVKYSIHGAFGYVSITTNKVHRLLETNDYISHWALFQSQIHIDILIGLNRIHSIGRDKYSKPPKTRKHHRNPIITFPLPIVLNTPIL